jgi:hypothetical protein
MIADKELMMSDAQALTTQGASIASTVVIDTKAAGDPEDPLFWYIKVVAAFTSGGSGTLAAKLQHSVDNSTWTDVPIASVGTTALAGLGAGTELAKVSLPYKMKRYIRTLYTVATADMTGGTIDSMLIKEVDNT